jgi:hypothetical protein
MYDIMLEFIDPANRFLHAAESGITYTDEDIRATQLNAYADDLCTITSGPRAGYMQTLQAKWLSAFCTFTGMAMHPLKIKPTMVGPPKEAPLKHVTVYDHSWTPVQCPILPDLQTYKYLGVHLDLRNNPSVHPSTAYWSMRLAPLRSRSTSFDARSCPLSSTLRYAPTGH